MFQYSSKTMNSGDAVGNHTGIKVSLCFSSQNNDQLFEICNAVELYPETDNILGTCSVSALDICKNYLH